MVKERGLMGMLRETYSAFVQDPQFSLRGLLIRRVGEDAAIKESAVGVGHHAPCKTGRGYCQRKEAITQRRFHGKRPVWKNRWRGHIPIYLPEYGFPPSSAGYFKLSK